MKRTLLSPLLLMMCLVLPFTSARGEEQAVEGPVTFWPLIDIRTTADGSKSVSLLGPLLDLEWTKEERSVSVRPVYHDKVLLSDGSSRTDYLYPIASRVKDSEGSSFTVLRGLYEKNSYAGGAPENKTSRGTMLFPFYISGHSEKYGPYTSIFPFYGDIYERFWRDEYHYVMFPLYSRTVKKGTETTNYLYPFFSVIKGEKERGFQVWPLYGAAEKEGVYKKRFALWPFYISEDSGLNTDNPTSRRLLFPLYVSQDSPKGQSRHYLWPFFGYTDRLQPVSHEKYYFWPFWWTVTGEKRNAEYFLPFYASDRAQSSTKTWIMWPGYRHDVIESERFVQEKTNLLVFLYRDNLEEWPKDGVSRRKVGFWPLFSFTRDQKNQQRFTFPALLETIVDSDGVEENWAPLWRLYRHEWNPAGDESVSFLWNLFWYENNGKWQGHELFPLWRYTTIASQDDFSIMKGLFRYRVTASEGKIGLFWIPELIRWERSGKTASEVSTK